MMINGIEITFDVEAYICRHIADVKLVGNELFACCPFHEINVGRPDREPSWSVNTVTGVHSCFSCGAGGSLIALVKFLDKHDTMYDAEQWLTGLYGVFTSTTLAEPLELRFDDPEPIYTGIPELVLTKYAYRHSYLADRGISDTWQTVFGIGYDKAAHAVTIPWRFSDGTLATVKKRSVSVKRFWYEPPVPSGAKRRLMWGFDKIVGNVKSVKAVAIVESETDAMYVWQTLWQRYGVASTALGGSKPSAEQLALVRRYIPATTEIIVMTDNNAAGRLAAEVLTEALAGTYNVSMIDWTLEPSYTDVNELDGETLVRLYERRVDAVGVALSRQLI